ncbi:MULTISPECIES: hypothetical protein [Chryseobacterium]|uniref:Uncharacterized protein n=1 Tax=Chryseobacterium camelliae TaxID=1265445 RepID=A0ABU0TFK4_9FLAO|nr:MULTISPECIES: hypothetical protein [Chryseobacterium]MDT3406369.1 hypothetical protein [Pseudacidovorax intermedius]MDQ1095833.1 hypothetical protein [Chryseobacterium camelliae]MDQ1099769.1 hypothetical protein [Chryseobacterium sp. SORGH_AS_1048]MDR6087116.1 hypothetical protein [Chryseobacterium sp. SORGH_AS_0909]MDR6131489.1 hypothetical protein [Chryseobacterium sp. SORGH_AS_1175]
MKPKKIAGVPPQKTGGFHDTESLKKFDSPEKAAENFHLLKERLFSVNEWKSYCGKGSADFQLYDSAGHPVQRIPRISDFIRINIPGPGDQAGKGFDWVEIIQITHQNTDQKESILITSSPCSNPEENKNSYIAHFYSEKATSNFRISHSGSILKAGIHGRNESPNFKAKLTDKIRNLMVALVGIFGFSKIQWKCLTDGLLDFDSH